jgi:uncharacterized membrane protein
MRASPPHGAVAVVAPASGRRQRVKNLVVFVFFSNRLGCLTSLLISVVVTALLILLLRP